MSQATIVWVESPEVHRYVRETTILHPRRRARPGRYWVPGGGLLVAYSVLPEDAPPSSPAGGHRRQVWWLADRDLDAHGPYRDGGQPCEAVDPMRLVFAGAGASRAHRSWQ